MLWCAVHTQTVSTKLTYLSRVLLALRSLFSFFDFIAIIRSLYIFTLGNSELFKVSVRHMGMPPFSVTTVIENEEK
jgi:hypothetical protein